MLDFFPMISLLKLLSQGGEHGRLSILIYHRVLRIHDPLIPWAVTADTFTGHMQALRNYFNVIPLREAVDRLISASLPPRAAAVTFDDGYCDNLTLAVPILERYQLPATVFVASDFLDGGRMWNDTIIEAVRSGPQLLELADIGLGSIELTDEASRIRAASALLRQLKYLPHERRLAIAEEIGERCGASLPSDLMLTTDEVRKLYAAGIDIGGHTLSHPILSKLNDQSARIEIAENRERLTDIIRAPVRVFAYPNGRPGYDYSATHVRMVRECGYSGAVSTESGTSTSSIDRYQLRRFTPWDRQPDRFTLRMTQNLLSHRFGRSTKGRIY